MGRIKRSLITRALLQAALTLLAHCGNIRYLAPMQFTHPNLKRISQATLFFELETNLPKKLGYLRITPCYFQNPATTDLF